MAATTSTPPVMNEKAPSPVASPSNAPPSGPSPAISPIVPQSSPQPANQAPVGTATQSATTAQTPAPSNFTQLPFSNAAAQPASLRARLNLAESHWAYKLGLRAFLILIAIIGIGCAAWVTSLTTTGPYTYALDDAWTFPWTLITFGVSLIWCATCIIVLFLRRPHAPVHPGVAVGMDLILWLAFICTALFALVGALSVQRWGEDGQIGEYSSYGSYNLASNGTWVWNATDYDAYSGRNRDCDYSGLYSGYGFENCAQEDAYINALWKGKAHRVGVEMTAVACQFISLFVHLALFIWACVDTHYRNSRKTNKDAERLAADIVMNMVNSGAIIRPPHQGYQMLPGSANGGQQMHPAQYPQAMWPRQQQLQQNHNGPIMPGPSYQPQVRTPQPLPVKDESARFA